MLAKAGIPNAKIKEKMDSEEKYLDLYEKNPFKTDLKYTMKALFNILFKGARSS